MSSTCRPPLLLPLAPPRPCDLPTEDKTSRRDLVGNNQSTRCLSVKSHACGVELGSALKCVRKSAAVPATRNVPKDSASITPLKMLWGSIGEVRHALSSLNLSACKTTGMTCSMLSKIVLLLTTNGQFHNHNAASLQIWRRSRKGIHY